jgi:ribonuclease G
MNVRRALPGFKSLENMSKEMIVSVNGREKKIAVIENGQVTEFYIERGEATAQGIVGNIYKGRVMRVLPGMQSAFVDIGLERDAFLYVSDFFDEEEEFERIVIEKKKSELTAASPAAQSIVAPPQSSRRDAVPPPAPQHQTESQTLAEQSAEEPVASATAILEIAPEVSGEAGADTSAAAGGRKRRRRRGGRGGATDATRDDVSTEMFAASDATTNLARSSADAGTAFDESPFSASALGGASSFERVVDEDENKMADEGEMLKDAILQERLFDQIRAGEFNIEATSPVEVGALLSSAMTDDASFERIDDSDIEASETRPRDVAPQIEEAHLTETGEFVDTLFLDNVANENEASALVFERISDEEGETAAVAAARPTQTEAKAASSAPAKRKRSTRTAKSKQTADTITTAEKSSDEISAGKGRRKRSTNSSQAASADNRTSARKSAAGAGSTSKRSRSKRKADSNAIEESNFNNGEALSDAEASVRSKRARGEFSARRRRGGNRRRPNRTSSEVVVVEEADDKNHLAPLIEEEQDVSEASSSSTPPVVMQLPAAAAAAPSPASGNGRHYQQQQNAPANGGRRERRDRHAPPPMITDLLREGQEIIVQIAKEPISQKGARITSHIALPGRFLVYMPTIEHVGVSRKIESDSERIRLRRLIQAIRAEEDVPSGGFIVRTAGTGITEQDLREDARYLVRTWRDIRRASEKQKAPALVHRDLDLVQRLLRDQLSEDFTAIRVDSEEEYLRVAEFVNRIQPRLTNRVKLYTRDEPILDAFGVQAEIDKAIKPRVWLRSGGYLVINQTEALVAIDVNTGKFVGRGGSRLEDTITKTNMEAVEEIARQIRLRDLGGIIVLDLIDMEDRRNRQRVLQTLHEALAHDKSPTKVLSFNDFGLVIMTRKRVKQSLERTLCAPCPYCQGAALVKSATTVCYEILEEARRLARGMSAERVKQTTLRVNPEINRALRSTERDVLTEIEDYLGAVDITSDEHVHQEQFDFAFV